MKLEILGTQLNIWGIYCAIGALCAVAAMGVVCFHRKVKTGSAAILGLLSLLLGIICSRVIYCLFMTMTTVRLPFTSWIRITDGGWSLFGMIGGVMLAAWISAKITRESPGKMLDAVSTALPLMIAAERIGEGALQSFFNETKDVFNLSRPVSSEGFLTIVNSGKTYLATYRIDAFLAMILFLILVFSLLNRKNRDGDIWILFMLLCGAGGVLAESLRKDQFLEYSFVRIQQVLAAVMMVAGIAAAGYRNRKKTGYLYIVALITVLLTIAECIGLEFIIDRSKATHSTIYGVMMGALAIPVIQGILLMSMRRGNDGTDSAAVEKKLSAVTAAALSVSLAVTISLLLEMGRIHYTDKYMLLAVLPAAVILMLHCAITHLAFRVKNHPDTQENR